MSDNETRTEKAVISLEDSLKEMPELLQLFSLSMRGLYSKKKVSASANADGKVIELRDKTRNDAKLFVKVILPLTTKLVSSIKEFFEVYEDLSYEEWCEMSPDILEDVKTYKEFAEMLRNMYEQRIVPLKKREGEAKNTMEDSKTLQDAYEEMKAQFEGKAKKKRIWTYALAFIPVVNIIACPLLKFYSNKDTAEAIANKAESESQAAAVGVAEILVPALTQFIKGLAKATGFFEIIEVEMETFQKRAEKSKGSAEESRRKIHYTMMNKKAKQIKTYSHTFYAALTDIRTDFETIPDGDTEQKYIDKWMHEEAIPEIRTKRKATREAFLDTLKGIEGIYLNPKHFLLSLEPADTS